LRTRAKGLITEAERLLEVAADNEKEMNL